MANRLNDLSGREWIKFTKSWFVHNPPRRRAGELLHPAKFPETLVAEFIRFFTHAGQWVLDPFLGTGSALVAAASCGRNGVGVELSEKYATIARERVAAAAAGGEDCRQLVLQGDARRLRALLAEAGIGQVDYCVTSPPYWNQLHRHSLRQRDRAAEGLDTRYGESQADLGNIAGYEEFLAAQKEIFDQVYEVMVPGGYLTVITNNVYTAGRLFPLAFDTVRSLGATWVPKDERIWLQDDKRLLPLGLNSAWVGNRHHQYCLIFRKESG
ncbi:MAG: DNA methyltransferase [Dehalococcoidales bacterium]|nr:DNA methyltransferase [Dehalococcoidales bacterium]